MSTLKKIWNLDTGKYDVIMTSDNVIRSIKLSPEVRDDEYIIVCNLGGCRMSGLEGIEGGLRSLPASRVKKKKARSE